MVDLNQIKMAFFDLEDKNIKGFITKCQKHSIELCLVSYTGNSTNIQDKLKWAQKTYGVSFELCSAPSVELTIAVMETMAKLRGYNCNEILLISTNIEAVGRAKQKGFLILKDLSMDFAITQSNRAKIGYTDTTTDLVIPETFYDEEDGVWYNVTKIEDYAFYSCYNLKSVTIGNSVTSLGRFAFAYCTNLESVVISDTTTIIMDFTFCNCVNLKSVIIGRSVDTIGSCAFEDCENLESIVIPDSVSEIGAQAFYNCFSLESVSIPDSVTSIGSNAFKNVPKVIYNGPATGSPWGAKSISKS